MAAAAARYGHESNRLEIFKLDAGLAASSVIEYSIVL